MTALGDILRRFRFHGVPGAPGMAGVPADRTAELEAELTPVFAALEEAQRQTAASVAQAEGEAAEQRSAAHAEGRKLVAEARAGAASARVAAATRRLALAEAERATILADAEREAARVERTAAQGTPALVERVVEHILSLGGPTKESHP